jgi:phosphoglycolate phosphatase
MLMKRILPSAEVNDKNIEDCLKTFRSIYQKHSMDTSKPYADVPELLDTLVELKLKLAILSNKPDTFAQQCVNTLLSRWRFDQVLGQRDDFPPKPDPTGAHMVAADLDINPDQLLYLGDSGADMQTACAAGMYPVGALWGYRSKDELQENGAEALISNPMELLPLVR